MQLKIRRRIDPTPELRTWLDGSLQSEEIQDKAGRYHYYTDDAIPRDSQWTDEIMRSTLLWVVMDEDNNVHGIFNSPDKAERAMTGAKVVMQVDVDVDIPEADPEVEGDEPDAPRRGRPPKDRP